MLFLAFLVASVVADDGSQELAGSFSGILLGDLFARVGGVSLF